MIDPDGLYHNRNFRSKFDRSQFTKDKRETEGMKNICYLCKKLTNVKVIMFPEKNRPVYFELCGNCYTPENINKLEIIAHDIDSNESLRTLRINYETELLNELANIQNNITYAQHILTDIMITLNQLNKIIELAKADLAKHKDYDIVGSLDPQTEVREDA